VVLMLAPGDYLAQLPRTATVTIADNDQPAVTIVATDPNAAETTTGSNTGTFTILRAGPTTAPMTVTFTVGGTATNGVDYVLIPGSVTIPAGPSSATVTVTPIDDTLAEGSETVVLTLTAGSTYSVGSPGTATVVIADNDNLPPVLQPITDVTVARGQQVVTVG